ncbi:response regulator [Sorangium sp. So ce1389]|uniref:response regulator n=1 Tax=Sorangium sp. So ce1389 TaxID=3133336 RepID=UPI003F63432D
MAAKEKILVIEDDRDSSNMLLEMLRMANYEAESASTADQAVTALISQRYGAALLDLTVKGATTEELIELLQELPERPPIVIFSARMPDDLRNAAEKLSAAAVIQKPASMATLLTTLKRVICTAT